MRNSIHISYFTKYIINILFIHNIFIVIFKDYIQRGGEKIYTYISDFFDIFDFDKVSGHCMCTFIFIYKSAHAATRYLISLIL